MNRKTISTATLVATALTAGMILGGCSNDPAPSNTTTVAAPTDTTPAPAQTPVAEPTETTPAAPEVDEFSQVIDGKVYQGTENAPVRIGDDTPGKAPKAEKKFPTKGGFKKIKPAAIALDPQKYTVVVSPVPKNIGAANSPIAGYHWMVFRVNQWGGWKAGEDSTLLGIDLYPTAKAAANAEHTLDGRVLDRAEYVIAYY